MSEAKHLRYSMMCASIDCNENRHPQIVMRELGITYKHSTPQSMADQWWFWVCESVPNELPKFLTPMKNNPHDCVGYGLSKENADYIASFSADAQSTPAVGKE